MANVSATEKKLARFLGWFSLGLGIPQLVAPERVNDLIGIENDTTTKGWQRVVGVRELAAAGALIPSDRPPAVWLWARVAGDVKDLTLLGLALKNRSEDRDRTLGATAAVAGVMVADLYTAIRLNQATPEIAKQIRVAVTIREERADLHRRWD